MARHRSALCPVPRSCQARPQAVVNMHDADGPLPFGHEEAGDLARWFIRCTASAPSALP